MKKISILIPVYNFDIRDLVSELLKEIENEKIGSEIEILILDDCSTENDLKSQNQTFLENLIPVRYIASDKNLGRAKARNYLSKIADGNYLLFLDCDTVPDGHFFIKKYLDNTSNDTKIICGGISYIKVRSFLQEEEFYLHFSIRTDVKNPEDRNKSPWQSFLSSNFFVEKSTMQRFPFDENFTGYGYEDLDWAVTLDLNGIKVLHIDNTVTHKGLINEDLFFDRSKNALKNYVKFSKKYPKHFHKTKIYKIIFFMKLFSIPVLKEIDKVFIRLYSSKRYGFSIRFFAFQLSKAATFEIENRVYR